LDADGDEGLFPLVLVEELSESELPLLHEVIRIKAAVKAAVILTAFPFKKLNIIIDNRPFFMKTFSLRQAICPDEIAFILPYNPFF